MANDTKQDELALVENCSSCKAAKNEVDKRLHELLNFDCNLRITWMIVCMSRKQDDSKSLFVCMESSQNVW